MLSCQKGGGGRGGQRENNFSSEGGGIEQKGILYDGRGDISANLFREGFHKKKKLSTLVDKGGGSSEHTET